VYGYDVHKHQPHHNNGEIDVEYLQAYVAECRAREEQEAKQAALAKQKEALKGSVSAVTTKKPAAPKKELTVETDSKPPNNLETKPDKMLDEPDTDSTPNQKEEAFENFDDDFERDEDSQLSKKQLEEQSSNSVASLNREEEEESQL
jgi:hypothetical protein